MLYLKDKKCILFRDINNKKYTPCSLYKGSKKIAGYKIKELYPRGKNLFGNIQRNDSLQITENISITRSGYKIQLPKGQYTFSFEDIGSTPMYYKKLNNGVYGTLYVVSNKKFTTTIETNDFLLVYCSSAISWNNISRIQLEEGAVATSYEPFILVTAISESDTYNDNAELIISGKSEQIITVQGKNLFNKNTVVRDDNHYINDSGVITSSSGSGYFTNLITVLPNTDYYITGTGKEKIYFFNNNTFISRTTLNTSGETFTTPANCNGVTFQYLVASIDTSNWQLKEGTSVTTYVPFVPNSPSPDYPSPINSVDNFDLISGGKNIFNYQSMFFTNTTREDDLISLKPLVYDRILRKNYWTPKPSTNYTIVLDVIENTFSQKCVFLLDSRFYFEDTNQPIEIGFVGRKAFNVTTRADFSTVTMGSVWFNTLKTVTGTLKLKLMILEGTYNAETAGKYQKYISQTINFPYTLRSLPNGVKDYIEIDNINKTAKLHQNIKEITLNGSETWTNYAVISNNDYYTPILDGIVQGVDDINVISSHFKGYAYNTFSISNVMGVAISPSGVSLHINDKVSASSTDFKNWLADNNVKVQYKLATPTITDLDYNEVFTYYPYTRIYTNAIIQPTLEGKIRIIDRLS